MGGTSPGTIIKLSHSPNKKRKNEYSAQSSLDNSISHFSNEEALDFEHNTDEPVLSHAERRKRKRNAKFALPKETASKRLKLKDGGSEEVTPTVPSNKRQNSVWVGNLSFKTTQQNIKAFFESAGEITRIHLPMKAASRPELRSENRGFAYVDFETEEEKEAAIALSEQPLLGRKLLIKNGDDFSGRPTNVISDSISTTSLKSTTHSKTAQKILRVQKQQPAPTLFIGNLGFEVTEMDIRQMFEANHPKKKQGKMTTEDNNLENNRETFVRIRKIRMGTFQDSGNCKGFAFVDFTSVEHSTEALINPRNHQLNGRKLVVEYATPDAVRRGAPNEKHNNQKQNGRHKVVRPARRISCNTPRLETPVQQQHVVMNDAPAETTAGERFTEKKSDSERGHKHKGLKRRVTPGAALAYAKRESTAIVPSQGQKITF